MVIGEGERLILIYTPAGVAEPGIKRDSVVSGQLSHEQNRSNCVTADHISPQFIRCLPALERNLRPSRPGRAGGLGGRPSGLGHRGTPQREFGTTSGSPGLRRRGGCGSELVNQPGALQRLGPWPRVKTFFLPPPSFASSTQLIPSRKMLFTRLSLAAFASALVGSVAAELSIIAPGGSTLWWGE